MFQFFFVEGSFQNPSQAWHSLHTVKFTRVRAGVFISLIIPCRNTVETSVFFEQSQSLRKIREEIWRDVKIFSPDNDIFRFGINVESSRQGGFIMLRNSCIPNTYGCMLNTSEAKKFGHGQGLCIEAVDEHGNHGGVGSVR